MEIARLIDILNKRYRKIYLLRRDRMYLLTNFAFLIFRDALSFMLLMKRLLKKRPTIIKINA